MGDFKEWLSDNLRYFLVGVVVILIIGGSILGLKIYSSKVNGNSDPAVIRKNTEAQTETCLLYTSYIGLCRAVDEYKPQEGVAFMTYAGYWIRQQMQRYVENCSSVVRVPSHAREKIRKQEKLASEWQKKFGNRPEVRQYTWDTQSNTIELARSASKGRIRSLDASVGEDGERCV